MTNLLTPIRLTTVAISMFVTFFVVPMSSSEAAQTIGTALTPPIVVTSAGPDQPAPGSSVIATSANGTFVVAWYSARNEDRRLYAQRFLADGTTAGARILVAPGPAFAENSSTSSIALSVAASGEFVIAYILRDPDFQGIDALFVRQYSSNGQPRGERVFVARTPAEPLPNMFLGDTATLYPARVAIGDTGDFVIAWTTERTQAFDFRSLLRVKETTVLTRRYSRDGVALSDATVVARRISPPILETFGGIGIGIQLAMAPDGRYAVAYPVANGAVTALGLRTPLAQRAQLFSADGREQGPPIAFTQGTDGVPAPQGFSGMTFAADGDLVISWRTEDGYRLGSPLSLYFRRYGPGGLPRGRTVRVTGPALLAGLAPIPSGGLMLAWSTGNGDIEPGRFLAQYYAADDSPIGEQIVIADGINARFLQASAATDGAGNLAATWNTSFDPPRPGAPAAVYAQRFRGP